MYRKVRLGLVIRTACGKIMMGSYRDVALSEKIEFRQSIIETKNFIMLSSTCLYIACPFCSALHRLQV